jgi:transcription initiation factor TFIIE subunit alpha
MEQKILKLDTTKNYLEGIDDKAYNFLRVWQKYNEINKDEELANLFKVKVTTIRSILNKLHYRNVVNYDKVKDPNRGWFHYFWYINYNKLAKLIFSENKERITKNTEKLKFISEYEMYNCVSKCETHPLEVAAEYNFICPHCSENLNRCDKEKEIEILEVYLKKIQKENKVLGNFLIKGEKDKQ